MRLYNACPTLLACWLVGRLVGLPGTTHRAPTASDFLAFTSLCRMTATQAQLRDSVRRWSQSFSTSAASTSSASLSLARVGHVSCHAAVDMVSQLRSIALGGHQPRTIVMRLYSACEDVAVACVAALHDASHMDLAVLTLEAMCARLEVRQHIVYLCSIHTRVGGVYMCRRDVSRRLSTQCNCRVT